MATSTIPNLTVKYVKYSKSFNWASTTNPNVSTNWDVSVTGYKPVAVNYEVTGTGLSTVYVNQCLVDGNKVYFSARMTNNPSSVSQNGVNLYVVYVPANSVAVSTAS